jgi:peptidoglycan-N-acetylmuramic acid deacetylase
MVAVTAAYASFATCFPDAGATEAPISASRCSRDLPPNTSMNWWLIYRGAHRRPGIPAQAASLLHRFSGVWAGNRRYRIVYLTFDAGEETGNTNRIVGILDRVNVKASFFLTGAYMRSHPVLTRRLVAHGHLVCNHGNMHYSMVALARNRARFTRDIRGAERAYRDATGRELAPFVRPPYGNYSPRSLFLAGRLGYTTVFWSFAHVDYEANHQPPPSVTVARILAASHPGAIHLLHASSSSNTNALAKAIRGLRAQGYRFATLDELR